MLINNKNNEDDFQITSNDEAVDVAKEIKCLCTLLAMGLEYSHLSSGLTEDCHESERGKRDPAKMYMR